MLDEHPLFTEELPRTGRSFNTCIWPDLDRAKASNLHVSSQNIPLSQNLFLLIGAKKKKKLKSLEGICTTSPWSLPWIRATLIWLHEIDVMVPENKR